MSTFQGYARLSYDCIFYNKKDEQISTDFCNDTLEEAESRASEEITRLMRESTEVKPYYYAEIKTYVTPVY